MEVTVLNRQRAHPVQRSGLADFVRRVGRELLSDADATVTVCLVSDRRMHELNRRFRGRDCATDVLSFPGGGPTREAALHVGDIVIAVPVAARQAREARHSLAHELKLLALHGYLHLLGYDHEVDDGAMRRLERRMVQRLAASRRSA